MTSPAPFQDPATVVPAPEPVPAPEERPSTNGPLLLGSATPSAPASPPEPPAPPAPPGGQSQAEIEAVLDDFRAWLANPAVLEDRQTADSSTATDTLDLHTVISQFVALRHEVHLQTRATRAQQEQSGETLQLLRQTVEGLQKAQAEVRREQQQAQEELLRPLLKTLIDLHEALTLGGREIGRVQENVAPDLDALLAADANGELLDRLIVEESVPAAAPPAEVGLLAPKVLSAGSDPDVPGSAGSPHSFWTRWFGGTGPVAARQREIDQARHAAERARQAAEQARRQAAVAEVKQQLQERARATREAGDRIRQSLSGLVTGYNMSVQRIERALRQHGLEPIPALGQPFDPERMEVLEAVTGTGRPSGEVVEEVRRGYLWNGRVFRFAQVRVARS